MMISNVYETIFKRKSIRKYHLIPLEDQSLTDINQLILDLVPLYKDIKVEIKIVSPGDVKGFIQVKAPCYIAAFSEVKEGYLTNAGFMLQQLDLSLSAMGMGCCWQGWPKPTREMRTNRDLEFIIALAFGLPNEKLYRDSIVEYKRKPIEQIKAHSVPADYITPARLAPCGGSEPWYFTGDDKTIHAYCKKSSLMTVDMVERMNKIDMGITLAHLWITARHFGKTAVFVSDQAACSNPPQGYFYITSLRMG